MGYTEETQRTFDLKLNLHCKKCAKDVSDIVLKIEGVVSIDIDKDLELGKATISGNVNPETVIKKLKKSANKHAELLGKEEESPPKINHQEMQIVLQQNPVRIDQRKVAPQPPVSGNVNPQRDTKKLKDKGKHGKEEEEERPTKKQQLEVKNVQHNPDQRKVTPQPSGLLCEYVGKRGERDIHELELKIYNKPFKCNRCREDGFTSGYRCKHCIFDLHKDCQNPKPEITHELFPGSIFKYRQKPGKLCDACGMEIHGHSYSCKEDNLDLHPACSKLPGKLHFSGTDFVLCKKVKYQCFWCKKEKPSWLAETKVAGLCYVSERYKFSCHVHCLSLVMQEAWKRRRGDLDRNGGDDDNDAISKALEKVDLKLVAPAKGSGGEGGRLFLGAVTIFLKTVIGILFGDPTGLIVYALTELVKELLTL